MTRHARTVSEERRGTRTMNLISPPADQRRTCVVSLTFTGEFEQLKSVLSEQLGYDGDWTDTANGKQLRSPDGAYINWFPSTRRIQVQGSPDVRPRVEQAIAEVLARPSPAPALSPTVRSSRSRKQREKIFVVHGHDHAAREQLELVLHKLDLQPFVLANTSGGGLTIIEALENETGPGPGKARFGIVLMTPDDMGYGKDEDATNAKPRARQNVVLEMGMLLAALGRSNVAILQKGFVEVPSDVHGILYIPFNEHVRQTVPKLIDRLQRAGFRLDPEAITNASS
jgi:predicted nucleotide-binding protein